MKVDEIMSKEVTSCDLNASAADAAKLMWDHDCGIIPVLKDGQEPVGVITDRDICMGVWLRNSPPSMISVEEIISGDVYSVSPKADVEAALEKMEQNQVRRLPVIDDTGELVGILSMNDIMLKVKDTSGKKVTNAWKAICEHREETDQPKSIGTSA